MFNQCFNNVVIDFIGCKNKYIQVEMFQVNLIPVWTPEGLQKD